LYGLSIFFHHVNCVSKLTFACLSVWWSVSQPVCWSFWKKINQELRAHKPNPTSFETTSFGYYHKVIHAVKFKGQGRVTILGTGFWHILVKSNGTCLVRLSSLHPPPSPIVFIYNFNTFLSICFIIYLHICYLWKHHRTEVRQVPQGKIQW